MLASELILSELGNEKKIALGLAWTWFAYRLALFGLELARGDSFLPTSRDRRTGVRANRSGMLPASLPVSMPWTMQSRHLGNPCRFAVNLVPVGLQVSKHA
jgi:hypothetical protein